MAVIAYMALVGLIYFSQRSLLYPGAGAAPLPEPANWGETIHIKTPDGEILQALYSQGDSDKPCVLLFFGNGDRVDNYAFLAQALAARLKERGADLVARHRGRQPRLDRDPNRSLALLLQAAEPGQPFQRRLGLAAGGRALPSLPSGADLERSAPGLQGQ